MEKTINIIAFEKDGHKTTMKMKELTQTLESIQEFVGGYIEVTPAIPDGDPNGYDLLIVMHEEGKLRDLPPTIAYVKDGEVIDFVAGNAFITRRRGEDFGSVTEEDLAYIKTRYHGNGLLDKNGVPHHVIVFDGNIKQF